MLSNLIRVSNRPIFLNKLEYLTPMKLLLVILSISASCTASAQINLLQKVKENSQKLISVQSGLSENDIKEGLTKAFSNGAEYAVQKASAINGFNDNTIIRIPFPQEAQKIETALMKMGFEEQIESFKKI